MCSTIFFKMTFSPILTRCTHREMSKVSHQMGTLIIFDGVILGNWLLLFGLPCLAWIFKNFHTMFKETVKLHFWRRQSSLSLSKRAGLTGGNLVSWLHSLLPGHVISHCFQHDYTSPVADSNILNFKM